MVKQPSKKLKNINISQGSDVKRGRPRKERAAGAEVDKCQMGIKVSKKSWEELKKIAHFQGVSSSALISTLISDYIQEHSKALQHVERAIKTAFKNKK